MSALARSDGVKKKTFSCLRLTNMQVNIIYKFLVSKHGPFFGMTVNVWHVFLPLFNFHVVPNMAQSTGLNKRVQAGQA